jgi:glycine/D-amino acid oxidase-like deaminating enzyme
MMGAMALSNRHPHVAVLGGGLQGCCIALALAERGARVTLYDRNDALMTQAAVVNEGRMHLGYIYAADTTLATARMMIRGALAFAPFIERHVGLSWTRLAASPPTIYLVHRATQRPVDELAAYLQAVHALVRDAVGGRKDAYFGVELGAAPRRWSSVELDKLFDRSLALAAFDTPEVAIDPLVLGQAVPERVKATPGIETRLQRSVNSVEDNGTALRVVSDGPEGPTRETYDHVVNALWDGRLRIDGTRGVQPSRPWIHRFKYGIRFRAPAGSSLPTVAIMLGPFGDLVTYGQGIVYLNWYPTCLEGISHAVSPPEWPRIPVEDRRARLVAGTLHAMAEIILPLRDLDAASLPDCTVRGGVIVAWGHSDIDDPASELHRRYEIGVTSTGRYHSVDPGKLTMTPYFAGVCADRIVVP